MPENFKSSHAINDSFRPRTTCVHFDKQKKKVYFLLHKSHAVLKRSTSHENTQPFKQSETSRTLNLKEIGGHFGNIFLTSF